MEINKPSAFRTWCIDRWFEHCDEVEQWSGSRVDYESEEYFAMYKYWLKREFVHQRKKEKQ